MHQTNSLLSAPERDHIAADELKSLDEIAETSDVINSIVNAEEVVDNKLIAKLLRLINAHQFLKYSFKVCQVEYASEQNRILTYHDLNNRLKLEANAQISL